VILGGSGLVISSGVLAVVGKSVIFAVMMSLLSLCVRGVDCVVVVVVIGGCIVVDAGDVVFFGSTGVVVLIVFVGNVVVVIVVVVEGGLSVGVVLTMFVLFVKVERISIRGL
jgi:hypothetical protein